MDYFGIMTAPIVNGSAGAAVEWASKAVTSGEGGGGRVRNFTAR